ncbi:hypothetical protein [Streptomyces sanyensis]|uniref:hypothetical protein n=1 Tax=Streptomyces sanyensis TaxID=568869 RepID=UPI0031E70F5D
MVLDRRVDAEADDLVEHVGEDPEALKGAAGGARDVREVLGEDVVPLRRDDAERRSERVALWRHRAQVGAGDGEALALDRGGTRLDAVARAVAGAVGDREDPRDPRPAANPLQFVEELGAQRADAGLVRPVLDVPPQQLLRGRAVHLVGEAAVQPADVVRERLQGEGDVGAVVRAVVGEVHAGLMVDAFRFHPGERVAGHQAAHAEAAYGQAGPARPLGGGTTDGLRGRARVVEDRGAALVEADQDDVPSASAQFTDQRTGGALQARPELVEGTRPAVEAVGHEHRPHEAAVALAVVHPGGAARELPGVVGMRRGGDQLLGRGGGERDRRCALERGDDVALCGFGHALPLTCCGHRVAAPLRRRAPS